MICTLNETIIRIKKVAEIGQQFWMLRTLQYVVRKLPKYEEAEVGSVHPLGHCFGFVGGCWDSQLVFNIQRLFRQMLADNQLVSRFSGNFLTIHVPKSSISISFHWANHRVSHSVQSVRSDMNMHKERNNGQYQN